MKWIKTFEELKPETYRNAGRKLKTIIDKRDRGDKLINYGDELEYGFYNMFYGVNDDSLSKKKFTKPSVKFDIIMDSVTGDDDIEDAVDYWSYGGRNLTFYLTFSFVCEQGVYSIGGKSLPLFSFEVKIANETSVDDDDDESIFELYKENKTLNISIIQPVLDFYDANTNGYGGARKYKYNGIFSDRKSALKFKKELPNLINDEIHGKIQEIFSFLGAETDDVVNCINGILNPSINYLYNENASRNSVFSTTGNIIQNPSKYKPSDIPKAIEKPSTITTTGDYKPVYNLKREQ